MMPGLAESQGRAVPFSEPCRRVARKGIEWPSMRSPNSDRARLSVSGGISCVIALAPARLAVRICALSPKADPYTISRSEYRGDDNQLVEAVAVSWPMASAGNPFRARLPSSVRLSHFP